MANVTEVVLVDGLRTPFGKLGGTLSTLSAIDLSAPLMKTLIEKHKIKGDQIDEVIIGQVIQAGCGQIPSRQALLKAGIPNTCESTTVNKVCASGMRAVSLADLRIRAGDGDIILAGGMESMSNAPYLLPKARTGLQLGHGQLLDHLFTDGLEDPFEPGGGYAVSVLRKAAESSV